MQINSYLANITYVDKGTSIDKQFAFNHSHFELIGKTFDPNGMTVEEANLVISRMNEIAYRDRTVSYRYSLPAH